MSALYPLFAWMLPLAALPVLFHFFLRIRKRTRPFSTLMFFHRIDPQLSSRRRLREWLILALRCLLILFFLLALARPVLRAAGGRGQLAVVLLVDNSASMQRRDEGGRSRLELALDGARALLGALRPGDLAGLVLLVRDPAVAAPEGLTADRALLLAAIEQVAATDAAASPADAIDRAVRMLAASPAPQAVLHLFTDLQRGEWNRVAVAPPHPRAGTTLLVHRFAPARGPEPNAVLRAVELPPRQVVAGRPAFADAVVRNGGDQAVSLVLHRRDDGGNAHSEPLALAAQEERRVRVPLAADAAGRRWAEVWIEGDAFPGDNRAGLAYAVAPRQKALLVGAPAEYGLLPIALSPTREGELSGLATRFVPPGEWGGGAVDADTRLVAATWSRLAQVLAAGAEAAGALRAYVEGGGNLLALPSPDASAPAANLPDWLGIGTDARREDLLGVPLRAFVRDAPVLDGLRADSGEVLLGGSRAVRHQALRVAPPWQALLGLESGVPLVATAPLGRGRLFASGLAFDPAWTTLPLKGAFVALVQNMALASDAVARSAVPGTAGERIADWPGSNATVRVRSLSGPPARWEGRRASIPSPPRAGVYELDDGTATRLLGIRGSPDEGQTSFLAGAPVPALGELRHSVRDFAGADALVRDTDRMRRSTDLYLPFLLLALLALAAEGWLANAPRRAAKPGAGAAAAPAPAAADRGGG